MPYGSRFFKMPKWLKHLNPYHSNKKNKSSSTKWLLIGQGAYNEAYKSSKPAKLIKESDYCGYWVKKIPKKIERSTLNDPKRAERISREINTDYPVAHFKEVDEEGNESSYWIFPFINGEEPSDDELKKFVLNIYLRTRRIILDALEPGNIIKFTENNDLVCVDVDLALHSSGSPRSQSFLSKAGDFFRTDWWVDRRENFPKTADLIETLYFLEKKISPECIKDRHITEEVMSSLSKLKNKESDEASLSFNKKLLEFILLHHQKSGPPTLDRLLAVIQDPTEMDKYKHQQSITLTDASKDELFPYVRELTTLMAEHLANNCLSKNPLLPTNTHQDKKQALLSLINKMNKAQSQKALKNLFDELIFISQQHRNPIRHAATFFSKNLIQSTSTYSCQTLINLLNGELKEHEEFTNFLKQKNKLDRLQVCNIESFKSYLFEPNIPTDKTTLMSEFETLSRLKSFQRALPRITGITREYKTSELSY